jgi:hypothetical protein
MPAKDTVLRVRYSKILTDTTTTLEHPYDDAEILPGDGVIFRSYVDPNDPGKGPVQTEILPWHGFDRLQIRRITREQFDKEIAEEHGVDLPEKLPSCFGAPGTSEDDIHCQKCPDAAACAAKELEARK